MPLPAPGYSEPADDVAAAAAGEPEWKGDKLPERPSPPAKPAEEPPTDREVLARSMSNWSLWLSSCDEPGDVNALLYKLKKEPGHCRQEVWDLICRTCKDETGPGWKYDAKEKKFFDPKPKADDGVKLGEAILF